MKAPRRNVKRILVSGRHHCPARVTALWSVLAKRFGLITLTPP